MSLKRRSSLLLLLFPRVLLRKIPARILSVDGLSVYTGKNPLLDGVKGENNKYLQGRKRGDGR